MHAVKVLCGSPTSLTIDTRLHSTNTIISFLRIPNELFMSAALAGGRSLPGGPKGESIESLEDPPTPQNVEQNILGYMDR